MIGRVRKKCERNYAKDDDGESEENNGEKTRELIVSDTQCSRTDFYPLLLSAYLISFVALIPSVVPHPFQVVQNIDLTCCIISYSDGYLEEK